MPLICVLGVIGAGYQNSSMRCNEPPTCFQSRSFWPRCDYREGILDLLLGASSRMFDGVMFTKKNGEVANTCGVNALRVVRNAIRMLTSWLGFLTFERHMSGHHPPRVGARHCVCGHI